MPGVMPSTPAALQVIWDQQLEDYVVAVQWKPRDEVVAAGTAQGNAVIAGSDGSVLARIPAHKGGLNSLSWNATGTRLATGGQDGQTRIFDGQTGHCIREIEAEAQWVECLSYSPLGEYLAIAAGKKLSLWNAETSCLERYPDQPTTISDIQWQPQSLFFAVACYGRLSIYKVGSTEPVQQFAWRGSILKIAWSPDTSYIATGNQDATVHFWFRRSGKDLEMAGYPSKIRELSWNSSSDLLATGGGPAITIWNCSGKGPAGTRPIELKGHIEPITALTFQAKGSLLASGGRDGRVCVWQIKKSGQLISGLEFPSAISQLCWSDSDRRLAVGTQDGKVAVMEAP